MKHRMDSLKNKTQIRALRKEDVHYCELEHGTIFGEVGVEETLDEIIRTLGRVQINKWM